MRRRTMSAAVAITVVIGCAGLGLSQRTGQAMEPDNNQAVVAAPAVSREHAGHGMTATEHIARMAMVGNVHAGHAMDEMAWAAARAGRARRRKGESSR